MLWLDNFLSILLFFDCLADGAIFLLPPPENRALFVFFFTPRKKKQENGNFFLLSYIRSVAREGNMRRKINSIIINKPSPHSPTGRKNPLLLHDKFAPLCLSEKMWGKKRDPDFSFFFPSLRSCPSYAAVVQGKPNICSQNCFRGRLSLFLDIFYNFDFFSRLRSKKVVYFRRYLLPNQASLVGATIFDWSTILQFKFNKTA